jgi:hypothetical protein
MQTTPAFAGSTRPPSRIEIELWSGGAEVRARDEIAMRTGKGVPHQVSRALRLRDAHIELAKFGFCEAGPWPPAPEARRQKGTDLA